MPVCISEDVERRLERTPRLNTVKRCVKCGLPARFILAIVCFICIMIQAYDQASLAVVIVAMVRVKPLVNVSLKEELGTEICPGALMPGASNPDGEFDWSETTQGMILSAPYCGFFLSQIIGGRLVDRFGNKRLICLSIFIAGTFTLLIPLIARTSFVLLLVSFLTIGGFVGLLTPAVVMLISNWIPPNERSRFSGIIFSANELGALVGASLSGVLAESGGWPLTFYFFGGLVLTTLIPVLLLVYETPSKHPRISDDERRLIMDALGHSADRTEQKAVPWAAILTSPPFLAACFIQFGDVWVETTLVSELPTFTRRILHFDISTSGYVAALPYIFSLATSIASGFVLQWLREKNCVSKINLYRIFNAVCTIFPAVALVLLTFVNCHEILTVGLIILVTVFSGCYPGSTYLNFMDLGSNYSGTLMGLQQTIGSLPLLVTPLLAGHIVDDNQTLSAWHKVFYISAVVVALPYFTFLVFGSVEEQKWNQPKETTKRY